MNSLLLPNTTKIPTSLLLLSLIAATPVEGWQPSSQAGIRARAVSKPTKKSPLFHPVRSSRLYDKINGSNNGESGPQVMGKRARIKSGLNNIWSAININNNSNSDSSHLQASNVDAPPQEEIVEELETENKLLRATIRQLEQENDRLHSQQKIILETFEGEGRPRRPQPGEMVGGPLGDLEEEFDMANFGITLSGEELSGDVTFAPEDGSSLWCDDLDEDSCPVEPTVSFGSALRDRAYWLVGLLIMQSCSGLILSRNEALLANHPIIIYFLTMLVGAGGNAGNQASVRVIRGIALGTLNERTQGQFLVREFKMAAALSSILSVAGFLRAAAFRTPLPETVAVTASLALIVFSSICLGAILPLILQKLGADPAHSSTTIQVVMDILGVVVAVAISTLVLDSPVGALLINKLGG